jgi:sugar/nucleoside kinase (ribokinase family)
MALLSNAKIFSTSTTTTCGKHNENGTTTSTTTTTKPKIVIRLCTKIGNDDIGLKLLRELDNAGVDLTSPLFIIAGAAAAAAAAVSVTATNQQQLQRRSRHTTTSIATVIVSESDHTRTCIYTPGSCGELSIEEDTMMDNTTTRKKRSTSSITSDCFDQIFAGNVVLVHLDGRHTEVALWLAKEANRRNIPISLDVEKDRNTSALDELLDEADLIFTNNSNEMDLYWERLYNTRQHRTTEQFMDNDNDSNNEDEPPNDCKDNFVPSITQKESILSSPPKIKSIRCGDTISPNMKLNPYINLLAQSIRPNTYFTRWSNPPAIGKQIIITHGNRGAIRVVTHSTEQQYCATRIEKDVANTNQSNTVYIDENQGQFPDKTIHHNHEIDITLQNSCFSYIEQKFSCETIGPLLLQSNNDDTNNNDGQCTELPPEIVDSSKCERRYNLTNYSACYHIHTVGILDSINVVVDTTGAGDAFIGAYLMAVIGKDHCHLDLTTHQCLQFASWVAGHKVQRYGARTALPTAADVDGILGTDIDQVKEYLEHSIGSFRCDSI